MEWSYCLHGVYCQFLSPHFRIIILPPAFFIFIQRILALKSQYPYFDFYLKLAFYHEFHYTSIWSGSYSSQWQKTTTTVCGAATVMLEIIGNDKRCWLVADYKNNREKKEQWVLKIRQEYYVYFMYNNVALLCWWSLLYEMKNITTTTASLVTLPITV